MKRIAPMIPLWLLAASAAVAGFRLPPGVYRMEAYSEAATRAQQLKKPLAILLSDENSSCPLSDSASLDAIKKLRLRTVVVYAHSRKDWDSLPGIVKSAFRSPEAGKYIPIVIVVDAEVKKVLAVIPYAREERERAKLFREAMRKF